MKFFTLRPDTRRLNVPVTVTSFLQWLEEGLEIDCLDGVHTDQNISALPANLHPRGTAKFSRKRQRACAFNLGALQDLIII